MEEQKRKLLVKANVQIKAGKSWGLNEFGLTEQEIQMVDEVINNKHKQYKSFQQYLNSLDSRIQYEVKKISNSPFDFMSGYEVMKFEVEEAPVVQVEDTTAPSEQLSTIDVLQVMNRHVFKPNQRFELWSNQNMLGVVVLQEDGLFWSTGEVVGFTTEVLQAKWKVEPPKKQIEIDQLQTVLDAGKKVFMINEKKQRETVIESNSTISVKELTQSKFFVEV